jgi:hypothetical protein
MATAVDTKKLRAHIDAQLADLEQMRDEIRVKLHLAGMDAKDSWRDLEPKLDKLEADVATGGENIADATLAFAQDLKQAFRKLRDRL